MVPHLAGRPITLRRYPNGVDGPSFFEKNCPSHRPDWVADGPAWATSRYCRVDEAASLVWVANLAAIELHPSLARGPDLDQPTTVVFDLDPGRRRDVLTCARVALILRELLGVARTCRLGSRRRAARACRSTCPSTADHQYQETKPFSQALAQVLEQAHPDLIVTTQDKAVAAGQGSDRLEPEHRVQDHGGGVLAAGPTATHGVDPGHLGRGRRRAERR